MIFTQPDLDSSLKTHEVHKIPALQKQETFGVVNRRQFGANYIPVIQFYSQAPHVQGHFEKRKQVVTGNNRKNTLSRKTQAR